LPLREHFGDNDELNPLGATRHSPLVRGRKCLGNSPDSERGFNPSGAKTRHLPLSARGATPIPALAHIIIFHLLLALFCYNMVGG
jgi:hypothetical protein